MKTTQPRSQRRTVPLILVAAAVIMLAFTSGPEPISSDERNSAQADGDLHDTILIIGILKPQGKSGIYSNRCVDAAHDEPFTEQ